MKLNHIALSALFVISALPAFAKAEMVAKDWQNQSLKGIASIKYGVTYDPSGSLTKTVAASLSGVKIPMKSVNLDKEREISLKASEARVKVYVDDRKDGSNKCWVGLTVEQMAQLDRQPSITFDSDTYSVGKLCTKKEADAAVKEVCAQFVEDLNKQTK